jgi:hypothetical protein
MVEPSINETQAAKYLTDAGIPIQPQTLRAWRHRGKGPAYLHPGGQVSYRISDLDAFIEASRVVPGEKPRRARSMRAVKRDRSQKLLAEARA